MRILITIFLCSAYYLTGYGQRAHHTKLIAKLHDGAIYIGQLIAEEGYDLDMLIGTGDTITISKLMVKELVDGRHSLIFDNGRYLKTSGYFWSFGMGSNFSDNQDNISTHLEIIFGTRLSKYTNIGIGTGFEFNATEVAGFRFDTQFSSIYLYGRQYLTNHRRRLFVYSRLGYGFPAVEEVEGVRGDHTGGYQAQYGLGLHFASRENSKFQLQFGQHYQSASGQEFFLDEFGNEIKTSYDLVIRRFLLKFIWEFK